MSVVERLLMEIFDGRRRIEDQLRRQADSYAESLAANLIADGQKPPPWIWPQQNNELIKEELISGVPFPLPRATTPFLKQRSLFTVPSLRAENIFQSNVSFTKTCPSERGYMDDRIELPNHDSLRDDGHGYNMKEPAEEVVVESAINGISQSKGFLTETCTSGRYSKLENVIEPEDHNCFKDIGQDFQLAKESNGKEVTSRKRSGDGTIKSKVSLTETCTSGRYSKLENGIEAEDHNFHKDIGQDSCLMEETNRNEVISMLDDGTSTQALDRGLNSENRFEQGLHNYLKDVNENSLFMVEPTAEELQHTMHNLVEDSVARQVHADPFADSAIPSNGFFSETSTSNIYFNKENWSGVGLSSYHEEQDFIMVEESKSEKEQVELDADSVLQANSFLTDTCLTNRCSDMKIGPGAAENGYPKGGGQGLDMVEELQHEVPADLKDNTVVLSKGVLTMTCTSDRSNTERGPEAGNGSYLDDGASVSHAMEKSEAKEVHNGSGKLSSIRNAGSRKSNFVARPDKNADFLEQLVKGSTGDANSEITRSLPPSLKFHSGLKDGRKVRSACAALAHSYIINSPQVAPSVLPVMSNGFNANPGTNTPDLDGFCFEISPFLKDSVALNSPDIDSLEKERASLIEQLFKSKGVLSPVSHPSTRQKINEIPVVCQSLPEEIFTENSLISPSQFDDAAVNVGSGTREITVKGFCFDMQTDQDSSLHKPHSYSLPSSLKSAGQVGKPPLTPPAGKVSQRVGSGRSVSSELVDSRHVCFRIDENTSTTEDDHGDNFESIPVKKVGYMFEKEVERKPLADITSLYQNAPSLTSMTDKYRERSSLDSVCTDMMDVSLGFASGYAINGMNKAGKEQNEATAVGKNRVRKAAESLSSRSSRLEPSANKKARNKSQIVLGKGAKPKNIVSNIASFIPLVQKKQQAAAPLVGKRDIIKVKSLAAAEAAKRLQEQKEIERDKKKVALKLERERLEKENKLKQKEAEENKKKREAEIAARKRQREEERRDKERKKRCTKARNQQKEKVEKMHWEKDFKDLQPKSAKKQEGSTLADESKCQPPSEGGNDPTECTKLTELKQAGPGLDRSNLDAHAHDVEKVVVKPDGLQSKVQDRRSFITGSQDAKSYEISPYRDSDDEDGDDGRRKKKYIPTWARRECLQKILLSVQCTDPTKIFARKSSFNLVEVLSPRLHRRIL